MENQQDILNAISTLSNSIDSLVMVDNNNEAIEVVVNKIIELVSKIK